MEKGTKNYKLPGKFKMKNFNQMAESNGQIC